jgi:hypothetical protein
MKQPPISPNSPEGHGMMLMLLPDAAHALTGREPAHQRGKELLDFRLWA